MHYEKYKANQVKALLNHNRRKHLNYSNDNINLSLLSNNTYAIRNPYEAYERIINAYQEKKKIRKDAVTLCEWVVTLPKDFTGNDMDFFKPACSFFAKRYGTENIVCISIHRDETRPHLHIDFVPITKDGRLCAKNLETAATLQKAIPEIEQYIERYAKRPVHIQTGKGGKIHKKREEYIAEMLKAQNERFRALYNDLLLNSYAIEYIKDKYADIWEEATRHGQIQSTEELEELLSGR